MSNANDEWEKASAARGRAIGNRAKQPAAEIDWDKALGRFATMAGELYPMKDFHRTGECGGICDHCEFHPEAICDDDCEGCCNDAESAS